jgi:capsular exopolysaccharide synthesis family protein
MQNIQNNSFDRYNEKETINYREQLGIYMRYWPWFILSIVIAFTVTFLFLRYNDVIYNTEAKVKILTDKEKSNFTLDVSKLLNKSNVNLENDIALFKSYSLAEKVVLNLNLNVNYFKSGRVRAKQVFDPPFIVKYAFNENQFVRDLDFTITITATGFEIEDNISGKTLKTKGYFFSYASRNFPILVYPNAQSKNKLLQNVEYRIMITSVSKSAKELSTALEVEADGKESDIILLSMKHPDGKQAQKIINNLIKVFEEDGVKDNQLVSKRTVQFVDERFKYIRKELSNIENSKKNYKKENNLSFVEGDAASSIQIKSAKEQALFEVETQLLLAKMLKENLSTQKNFDLLPANIGIQNANVNDLVDRFNTSVLELDKLKSSAGSNNPAVQIGLKQLSDQRKNIINSVNSYYIQLQTTKNQSAIAEQSAIGSFESLPEKERVLRDIDRQQNLKESLYLLLLQKREEASINLAITQPNTKVIDYAITNDDPVFPKKKVIFLSALLLGLIVPFGIIYLILLFDNKIYMATDIEKINKIVPILAELPTFTKGSELEEKESLVQNVEAFRTLAHNTEFVTPFTESKLGKVLFVTSAIKGEGKTFVAFNLANAYAYLNRKILIVGCDLRNPQLHKHLDESRKTNKGLSNYLYDGSLEWKDLVIKKQVDEYNFDVLLAGDIPPNPTLLLSSERFEKLINEIKAIYDIIIFDTPPTLLVTDSLIISKHADTTIYVARSGKTVKELIKYSSKLNIDNKITNMGYVVNDIHYKRGYGYGYGYNYNYSYNYGYGYGYGRDVEKTSWFSDLNNLLKRKEKD